MGSRRRRDRFRTARRCARPFRRPPAPKDGVDSLFGPGWGFIDRTGAERPITEHSAYRDHVARMTSLSDTDVHAELASLAYPRRNPMDPRSQHQARTLYYFLDLQVYPAYLRRFEQRAAAALVDPATTRAVKQVARRAQRVLARLRTQTRFARQGRRAIERQDDAAIHRGFLAARDALRPVCQRARRGFAQTWQWLSTHDRALHARLVAADVQPVHLVELRAAMNIACTLTAAEHHCSASYVKCVHRSQTPARLPAKPANKARE